jgi:uncharacterized protein (DUF2461 family)
MPPTTRRRSAHTPAHAGTLTGVDPLDFTGFPDAGLAFLREVAARQDRAWVQAHKVAYEAHVRGPLAALVVALTARCAEVGLPLRGDPKRSLFRLQRDVRFSADKRPFQTHASAVLTRTGEKRAPGVLYVHVAPEPARPARIAPERAGPEHVDSAAGGSFAAIGFYHPEPPDLAHLRGAIVARPTAWTRVERALADARLACDGADSLVRLPRGFEQALPRIHAALRRRSHVVIRPLTPAEIADPALPDTLVAFALAASPLLRFGWAALDAADPGASARGRPHGRARA